MKFDVVDLGTKQGYALRKFLRWDGAAVLPRTELLRYSPERCIGYDLPKKEHYRKDVEKRGFQFGLMDLADDQQVQELPEAEVYLAWHLLEHLPTKESAWKLMSQMLSRAKRLVWFRLPSFEQDRRGEGTLRAMGMRFAWTRWRGHTNPCLVADCTQVISHWQRQNPERRFVLRTKPASTIHNADDRRVVPVDAPLDTINYNKLLGPKPKGVLFSPPLVSEWDITVRFHENQKS